MHFFQILVSNICIYVFQINVCLVFKYMYIWWWIWLGKTQHLLTSFTRSFFKAKMLQSVAKDIFFVLWCKLFFHLFATSNHIYCTYTLVLKCLLQMMMIKNCFCRMVDQQRAFILTSNRDQWQRFSPPQISNTPPTQS